MEDYKEKYEQALERAKECHIDGLALHQPVKVVIEHIFPELIEIEDEKIRKDLINLIKETHVTNKYYDLNKMISWLEKQDPQYLPIINERVLLSLVSDVLTWKDGIGQYLDDPRVQVLVKRLCDKYASSLYDVPNSSQSSNGENKQELTDNIESKFKINDWIIKDGATWQVLIANNDYILLGQDGTSIKEKTSIIDSEFHLWTIQDAKDGDILCYKNDVFLLKNYTLFFDTVDSYCCYGYGGRFITSNRYSFTIADFNKIYPATKGQRDLLFQKMKEAGYEWDAEKKKLKKIEQKPAFCHHEVDLSGCSEEYRKAYYDGWNNCNQQHSQLKAEQKSAWSEEDEEKRIDTIKYLEIFDAQGIHGDVALPCITWLKSLKQKREGE